MASHLFALARLGYNLLKANVLKKRQPLFLSLFITNKCNLKCNYCFISDPSIPREILSMEYTKDEIFKIVDECYDLGTRMIYILGGEPLVHKDIGEVIDYIVNKGIYLHVVTNGCLIERKLDEIKNVHALCVSLDGLNEINDALRGDGVFAKAIEGIRAATKAGIPCRIHAVLHRNNLQQIRPLAELCRDMGIKLTISPPNYLGETEHEYLRITADEYKTFWTEYLGMHKEGLPIANSPDAIRKCIEWPIDYHQYMQVGETYEKYTPTFCLNGHLYAAIGADGTMYNCINLGCTHGPNIKEMGVKQAWDRLLEWRPNCTSCSSINCIETAMMMKLRWGILWEGLKLHRAVSE